MVEAKRVGRREVLERMAGASLVAACASSEPAPEAPRSRSNGEQGGRANEEKATLRKLGRTGAEVAPVSLGGEGILRTTGRSAEAVPVIVEALRRGVRYCDTAPAYEQSQDYYGEAF